MVPGGRGVCHAVGPCVSLAERALTESIAESQARAAGGDKLGAVSEKREAQQ